VRETAKTREDDEGAEDKPLAQLTRAENVPELVQSAIPEEWRTGKPVLCLPGLGQLDEALAMIVAQLLERRGIGAHAEEAGALSMSRIFALDTKDAKLLCLCYIETATAAQIRYSVRRLRRKAPDAHILVSLMGETQQMDDPPQDVRYTRGSLQATVDAIIAVATERPEAEAEKSKTPIPVETNAPRPVVSLAEKR